MTAKLLVPGMMLAGLVLSACSTVNVTTLHDPKGTFSAYRTFAWDPESASGVRTPETVEPATAAFIKKEVESALAGEGMTVAATAEAADLLVSCGVWTERRSATTPMPQEPRRTGPTSPRYGDTWTYDYDAGTIVVELVDPKIGKAVWRGFADAEIQRSAKEKQVHEAVAMIFAEYPPKN
jgi:hypothetical protein